MLAVATGWVSWICMIGASWGRPFGHARKAEAAIKPPNRIRIADTGCVLRQRIDVATAVSEKIV
jgi:hypothetical protein